MVKFTALINALFNHNIHSHSALVFSLIPIFPATRDDLDAYSTWSMIRCEDSFDSFTHLIYTVAQQTVVHTQWLANSSSTNSSSNTVAHKQ